MPGKIFAMSPVEKPEIVALSVEFARPVGLNVGITDVTVVFAG